MDGLENKIEEVFTSLDKINEVKIDASFKKEVLSNIDNATPELTYYNWFTPKLQIAAMVVVLLVNTLAVCHLFVNQDSASLESVAEQYSLVSTSSF